MILHVMIIEKFMPPFIDFLRNNFTFSKHKFVFITSEKYLLGLTHEHHPQFLHTDSDLVLLKRYMDESQKIILHGLWRDKVDKILLTYPELMKKCYWIMWGADFYFPEKQSKQRKEVIKNIRFLVTANFGDITYVQQHYAATGQQINCISYLSNVFYDLPVHESQHDTTNVLVGNSATTTNNHSHIFSKLADKISKDIKIYCPLSYGDKNYAQQIAQLGKQIFNTKFEALDSFMPFNEYQQFLSQMDFAVFDAERQQGFSNLLYLLGMGKKVFINKRSNLGPYFSDLGISVYDSENIELVPLTTEVRVKNMQNIRRTFTEEGLKHSLASWLEKDQ